MFNSKILISCSKVVVKKHCLSSYLYPHHSQYDHRLVAFPVLVIAVMICSSVNPSLYFTTTLFCRKSMSISVTPSNLVTTRLTAPAQPCMCTSQRRWGRHESELKRPTRDGEIIGYITYLAHHVYFQGNSVISLLGGHFLNKTCTEIDNFKRFRLFYRR